MFSGTSLLKQVQFGWHGFIKNILKGKTFGVSRHPWQYMGLEKITEVKRNGRNIWNFLLAMDPKYPLAWFVAPRWNFIWKQKNKNKKTKLARVIYDAASSMDTKLASLLRDGDWRWKSARSYECVAIQRKFAWLRMEIKTSLCG